MPNNNPEKIRKKLYEEYEDSLFKLIMYDAAEKEGKLFLEEKEKLKNASESLPSAEAFKRFSQQLDAHLKKPQAYARRRHILKALNRFAVAMLVVIVLLFTTVASVEALRAKVLNFLMDIQPEYTSFELRDNDNGSDGGSSTINWHKAYVPTYIPAGYEIIDISNGKLLRKIEFKNQQGLFITYTELSEGSKPALDTENTFVFETVSINGYEGTLVVKDSLVTIIWGMNNRMFMIRAQTEKDTAIKVAEGVKYID
ncbi:DUF4367 domain-containing protein [Desulfoscipio gibsoniae]|uniref:DUF4367 domain-containing protein n=1 Tax=Desulfoscipio gibsoniae DSM 7213 TaxID=767817 RepID=R4KP27_9FIRM|nr:DUF4367 domain-containing protein [Desulfoscipio gibsoniae]AGL03317.1 hypothetical protein Desgi_4044 [Desulfoscipio gibsoniae DSM 7213]